MKSDRKTNTMWYHLYVNSKMWHKWTYQQKRNGFSDREQTWSCQGGCGWGRERLRVWDYKMQAIIDKMDKQ